MQAAIRVGLSLGRFNISALAFPAPTACVVASTGRPRGSPCFSPMDLSAALLQALSTYVLVSSNVLGCACTYECVMYWQAAARQRVAQARQRAQAAQDDFNAANAEVAAAREAWEVARNEFRDMACASPILATALPAAAAAPPLSASAYLPPLPLPDFPPVAPDVVGVELHRTSDELPQTKVAHQPRYSTLTRSCHL